MVNNGEKRPGRIGVRECETLSWNDSETLRVNDRVFFSTVRSAQRDVACVFALGANAGVKFPQAYDSTVVEWLL